MNTRGRIESVSVKALGLIVAGGYALGIAAVLLYDHIARRLTRSH